MTDLIIANLIFWPAWMLLSIVPTYIMQRMIDKSE